ncbi:hypothetical protein ABPG75_000741 [Micractinium tetrahymenae]
MWQRGRIVAKESCMFLWSCPCHGGGGARTAPQSLPVTGGSCSCCRLAKRADHVSGTSVVQSRPKADTRSGVRQSVMASLSLCGLPAARCMGVRHSAAGALASPLAAAARQHRQRRHGQAPSTVPRAASAAEAAAEVVYEATGVPLVDALMKLKTVEAATQASIRLVAVALAGVVLGSLALRTIDHLTSRQLGQSKEGGFNVAAAVAASTLKPAQVLLPFYGVAYSTTVVSALVQVAAVKMKSEFATLCRGRSEEVLAVIKFVTQMVQDTSELVLIVFAAWAAIDFKNRVLGWAAAWLSSREKEGSSRTFIAQLLRPVSALLNCGILAAAGMAALTAYGINVGPLVASIGGLGLVVGLATQSLAANVVSALALYSGRPFVVGDRVELLAGGARVVEGVVVQIEPMRTILRDDSGAPVYMNNSEVTGYMVRNISQTGKDFASV